MNDLLSILRKIESQCHGAMDGARLEGGTALKHIESFAAIKKLAIDATVAAMRLEHHDHTPPRNIKGVGTPWVVAVSDGPADMAARNIDKIISDWLMRTYRRMPPAKVMTENITLVGATADHGTVFAWGGLCVYEFTVDRDGHVSHREVDDNFVEIIPKNSLT